MYRKVPVVKQKLIVDISDSHSFASIHIHLQFAYAGVVTSATFVNVHS